MLLTVGDSVCWGQGLKEKHKFDFLFAEAKGAQFTRSAHSGAVIGTKQDTSQETEAGEVPVGWPSIWQQVQSFKHWQDVDLVLLNGGINDVSLTRILNPGVSKTQLSQLVDQFCRQGMTDLLIATAEMMVKPNARIAVVGYYPILSTQSRGSDEQHQALLEMHGIATSSIVAGDQFSLRNFIPAIVVSAM